MPFHKLTLNRSLKFATLHNHGCVFKCPVCSYKLRSGPDGVPGLGHPRPDKFLSASEIKAAIEKLEIERLNFMGGEPTIAQELPELLDFAKNTLGLETWLGHTNGFKIPNADLDGANVGLKAWDPKIHKEYTGFDKDDIFGNFKKAFDNGVSLKANIVLVPGLVEENQIASVAAWIAGMSPEIPLHIMAYIPVPGQTFAQPSEGEVDSAVKAASKHLATVTRSRLYSPSSDRDLWTKDPRFDTERIL